MVMRFFVTCLQIVLELGVISQAAEVVAGERNSSMSEQNSCVVNSVFRTLLRMYFRSRHQKPSPLQLYFNFDCLSDL